MRKILLFPALMFTCMTAFADQGSGDNVTSTPDITGLFPHFTANNSAAGNAVVVDLRLIAKTYLTFKDAGFVPSDSTTYSYGGTRGSVPDPANLNSDDHVLFDISTTYSFNSSIWAYENSKQREQHFDNKKVSELIYKKWHAPSSTWKNAERYVYVYDNAGKMQSSLLDLWYGTLWTQSMVSTLNYDNSNNVVKMNSTTYTVDFVYDLNNNLVQIEDQVWGQSTGWIFNERKSYTYTGKDVSQYILEKWDNGNWVKSKKWEYAYDTDNNLVLTIEYDWTGTNWTGVLENEYKYDNNHNQLENTTRLWNAGANTFVNSKKETLRYNDKSLPENMTTATWNGQSWVFVSGDVSINYYYEHYDPTSIDLLAANAVMNIYPLPASENINISLKWDYPQDFTVSLKDMSGKVVYHHPEQAQKVYNESIPVSNLPAGSYILAISGNNNSLNRPIVVSH